MAVFDELPVGTFYLSAFHGTLVPATSVGSHSRHFVVGDDAVTVTMEELFGVVFECPTEAAVESASWNVPLLSLDLSPRIVSRLARARAALESRFPGSHVYVHQPRHPEDPPSIELRIAASDGTFWRGEWTLCRLGEIDQPVYMESVAPVGVARLTIRVLNRSGTPIAGFPLVVGNRETGHRVHTESGCELQCPYGRYGVFARNLGWTFRSFGGLQGVDLLVSEQTPEVVDIQLDLDLVEVEIRLLLPTPDPVNKLTISLDDEHGAGPVVANWAPARGPVRLHAPAGPLRVRVNSNGAYEPVDRWFTVPAVNERVCFEVPLVDSPASGR